METLSPAEHDHLICELQERIKELDCLYAISPIAADPHTTLDSILQDITDRIPSGFQKPESTCARVAIGNKVMQTANFKTCQWKLEVDIAGDEKTAGRSVHVDVRIIASTNRNLEEAIKDGGFRKDLFYRLNVFPVTIPPLRQRREDIPLLAEHFVTRFSKIHGKRISRIPPPILTALEAYSWPGNVRELMNVLERSVIIRDGPELRLAEGIEASATKAARDTVISEPKSLQVQDLSEMERSHILRILHETGWRIDGPKGAARLLGLNPSTLRTRMSKLGIRRPGD